MKFCKCLIAILLIVTLLPIRSFATQNDNNAEGVIYYDDGSYLIVRDITMDTRATFTKNAVREYTYCNANDEKQWVATFRATFTYNGTSCTCASSYLSFNILNDKWYVVSEEATKSGNVASCEFTMGYKFLGITTTKKTISMSITCDKDGNLS